MCTRPHRHSHPFYNERALFKEDYYDKKKNMCDEFAYIIIFCDEKNIIASVDIQQSFFFFYNNMLIVIVFFFTMFGVRI